MKKQATWTLTDHICCKCGGRVLQSASGVGVTGGGNPIFRCADCGVAAASMGPTAICWCGYQHRRADEPTYPYQCSRVERGKDDPALKKALLASGFSSDNRAEVGLIDVECYRLYREKEYE